MVVSPRMLTPQEVDAVVRDVDGWFGPHEGRLLYELAARADPTGVIVEIGSWHGRSTIWLAAGARAGRGAAVVAVDPHEGTELRAPGARTDEILRGNLARAGLAEQVQVVVGYSGDVASSWERPVSLLWIDGDHSFEGALADIEAWEPFLLPGAYVALHDTFVWDGPESVVRRRLIAPGGYADFRHAETTTAARYGRPHGVRESVVRRIGLARRSLYGIRLRAYDRDRLGYRRLRDLFSA